LALTVDATTVFEKVKLVPVLLPVVGIEVVTEDVVLVMTGARTSSVNKVGRSSGKVRVELVREKCVIVNA
jgi:hypothetical protein